MQQILSKLMYPSKNSTYYMIKNGSYCVFNFVCTFIHEYNTVMNIFGYSFMKNVDNQIYSHIHS